MKMIEFLWRQFIFRMKTWTGLLWRTRVWKRSRCRKGNFFNCSSINSNVIWRWGMKNCDSRKRLIAMSLIILKQRWEICRKSTMHWINCSLRLVENAKKVSRNCTTKSCSWTKEQHSSPINSSTLRNTLKWKVKHSALSNPRRHKSTRTNSKSRWNHELKKLKSWR